MTDSASPSLPESDEPSQREPQPVRLLPWIVAATFLALLALAGLTHYGMQVLQDREKPLAILRAMDCHVDLRGSPEWAPDWLNGILWSNEWKWPEGLLQADFVSCRKKSMTSQELKEFVAAFNALEASSLDLNSHQQDAKPLAELRNLTDLILYQVGDDEAASIGTFANLRTLELHYAELSPEGWAAIGSLRRLQELRIIDSNLDDEGLRHFDGLPELIWFAIQRANLTAAAVPTFESMPELRKLRLLSTGIPSDALAELGHRLAALED